MPLNAPPVNLNAQHVVLIGTGPMPVVWTGHTHFDLINFINDMDALGFAVWVTPSAVYVFTGEDA